MVGHILYGLILGAVYAGFDLVWRRLFIDADPLNRKREGPGVRLLLSVAWGSVAGFSGGLVAVPLMIETGVVTKLAGLESGLSAAIAIFLHLAVSNADRAGWRRHYLRGTAPPTLFCQRWAWSSVFDPVVRRH